MYDLIQINKYNGKAKINKNIKTLKELKETADFTNNDIYVRKILKNLQTKYRKLKNKSQDYYRAEKIQFNEWLERIYKGEEIPF